MMEANIEKATPRTQPSAVTTASSAAAIATIYGVVASPKLVTKQRKMLQRCAQVFGCQHQLNFVMCGSICPPCHAFTSYIDF